MAKKVLTIIKLQIPGGQANPAPPVGPALGQHGVNIMEFCKAYNAQTAHENGRIIPVEITVFEDRSFTFITKTPPAAVLIKEALGIESGSKHVRDGVEKGRFGSTEILKVVRKIQGAGINVIGNYIFGLPDDTHESMQETLDLALEANCEFANFYCAQAYPGSKLYGMAVEKRWQLPDSWIGYSQHSYETLPLRTEALTSAEVLKFRDDAFHHYFTNEAYLALVRRKFGEDVVSHIRDMTKIRLRRKLLEAGGARKPALTARRSRRSACPTRWRPRNVATWPRTTHSCARRPRGPRRRASTR